MKCCLVGREFLASPGHPLGTNFPIQPQLREVAGFVFVMPRCLLRYPGGTVFGLWPAAEKEGPKPAPLVFRSAPERGQTNAGTGSL